MKIYRQSDNTINIGLVMAGAVSAGAFTGGVVDYLLNSLALWEEKHRENPELIPKPNVKIAAITGASAGSIAAAIAMTSLVTRRFESFKDDLSIDANKNLQYYTWVNYGLQEDESILDELFSCSDLEEGKLKSLMNTGFIDDLIEKIKKIIDDSEIHDLPDFIAPNIEILMTLSNLRGIPINLKFSGEISKVAHSMSYHRAFADFTYNKVKDDKSTFNLSFRDPESVALFLDCARASGAFPVGLRSVPFSGISKEYITANLKNIFGENVHLEPVIGDTYEFMAVDGGMTNNEPIAEAIRILHEDDKKIPIVMIDPFPNYQDPEAALKKNDDRANSGYDISKDTLIDLIPQLFQTLRNQVLFKEKDIARLFDESSLYKMIWPTRYANEHTELNAEKGEALSNALATGALGGFSGFFHKKFREHDYYLGMKNCQNFIRYYFSQSPEESQWTEEQIEQFHFIDEKGEKRVPFIPDVRIEGRDDADKAFVPKIEKHIRFPGFPKVSQRELIREKLRPLIKERANQIVTVLLNSQMAKKEKPEHAFPSEARRSIIRLGALIPKSLIKWVAKKQIVKYVVPMVLDTISDSLADYDLFINNDKRPDTRFIKAR